MNALFSSPFLHRRLATLSPQLRGTLLKHFDHAAYALEHYLRKTIPQGSTICALYPKHILGSILPRIAQEKQCTVIIVHGTPEATRNLHAAGVLDTTHPIDSADLHLTEPDFFTEGGGLVTPEEAEHLAGRTLIGVGSGLQWTTRAPATHDYIPLTKTITEFGYNTPTLLHQELTSSAFSSLLS